MPFEYPSDNLSVPGTEVDDSRRSDKRTLLVGEARDFLDSKAALLHPLKTLKVARGLRELLHRRVDFTQEGYVKLLPQEIERRGAKADAFQEMPETHFLAEEQRLLEEG